MVTPSPVEGLTNATAMRYLIEELLSCQHPRGTIVTYVVTEACVDVKDRSCLDVCPVNCIVDGGPSMFIDAEKCIDCGACEPACPVEAIYFDAELPDEMAESLAKSAAFFAARKSA
jgi:ferredoxin